MPLQPGSPSDAEAGAMEELRRLLLGQEQVKLSDLERRIDDPTLRVEDVSAVLPQAVSRCVHQDGRLAGALAPAVEESLRASIRRDPAVLANAIFPIIGPAIRKAVSDAFRRVMQTFSTAMEHSLSWRGLRWRWDAWRTGRP
ncbi:MAG: OmpA family protein, partial [Verrucomicrobiales bacterium]|nr:OmpA family protein [Verrucomicrobiales bacterium]